jgi:hypothetical protein
MPVGIDFVAAVWKCRQAQDSGFPNPSQTCFRDHFDSMRSLREETKADGFRTTDISVASRPRFGSYSPARTGSATRKVAEDSAGFSWADPS